MRRIVVLAIALSALGTPGFAQRTGGGGTASSSPSSSRASNIGPGDTRSDIAPNLPAPSVGENASVRDYLMAARAALIAGRTGEAQEALEMAETRALDRSVPLFQTGVASKNPLIEEITRALQALGTGDRAGAAQTIEVALEKAK